MLNLFILNLLMFKTVPQLLLVRRVSFMMKHCRDRCRDMGEAREGVVSVVLLVQELFALENVHARSYIRTCTHIQMYVQMVKYLSRFVFQVERMCKLHVVLLILTSISTSDISLHAL